MYNKVTLATAMLCGLAAAADKGYTGTCKFESHGAEACSVPQGYIRLRQEPGSDIITRQLFVGGLPAECLAWIGIFHADSIPLAGWVEEADD